MPGSDLISSTLTDMPMTRIGEEIIRRARLTCAREVPREDLPQVLQMLGIFEPLDVKIAL